jgi:hypothetical protein
MAKKIPKRVNFAVFEVNIAISHLLSSLAKVILPRYTFGYASKKDTSGP